MIVDGSGVESGIGSVDRWMLSLTVLLRRGWDDLLAEKTEGPSLVKRLPRGSEPQPIGLWRRLRCSSALVAG